MALGKKMRRAFWRGLAAILPALVTFIVIVFFIGLVHTYFGQYVNTAIVLSLAAYRGEPFEDAQAWYDEHFLGWVGSVVAIIGLCVVAYIVGTFIGGKLVKWLELWLVRMPIVRKIYPGAKQVSEFFFSEKGVEFSRVVAVEFPRKNMWMVGFVTGRGLKEISEKTGSELLSVFIPFSPAPVTGYVVSVPRDEVLDLHITVDEALQYMISAGVVVPAAERVESLKVGFQMSHEDAQDLVQAAEAKAKETYPEDAVDVPPAGSPNQKPPDAK